MAELSQVLDRILQVRETVSRDGRATFARWRPAIRRRAFAASALNLAHYLALREHDLRELQRALIPLGVSSVGRSEAHVLASLDAVTCAVAALAGRSMTSVRRPSPRQFFRGEDRLAAAMSLLGTDLPGRQGHIMATLGSDAASGPEVIEKVVASGATSIRINCAHDNAERWTRMIRFVREAERSSGRRIPVFMDLAGPKVRTQGCVAPAEDRLGVGDEILLLRGSGPGSAAYAFQTGCTLPQALDRVRVGDRFAIDDGKVQGSVVREEAGHLVCAVQAAPVKGYRLKPEKGLNFPGVSLGLAPLTTKDLSDLDFVARHADGIGYSFVETAGDIARLQDELAARRADWAVLGLVPKIERTAAVANLPEIIVQAAGRQPAAVMIARGDLAVELGFERVAEMQEEILWVCEAANLPVIWATQVLDGLVRKGVPSRGEMTDAVMATRAECVMLNKGPNQPAGIAVLDRLMRRMVEHQSKKTPLLRALGSWRRRPKTSARSKPERM